MAASSAASDIRPAIDDSVGPDVAHLQKVEQELIWLRRLAMAGWAVTLYLLGYALEFSFVWLVYLGGIVYMLALHGLVRSRKNPAKTAWFGTIADPSLIFFMSWATGGIDSVFVPFLYFTVIATAFRFGDRETLLMSGLHVLFVLALIPLSAAGAGTTDVFFVLFCIVFSAGLGRLMARWARENVETALSQTTALRVERDRSRSLLHRLIDVQETERKQFAGDLHDRMGARLFAIQHNLDECMHLDGAQQDLRSRLNDMRTELLECSADVRSLMNELRPTVLDELGLYEAVTEYLSNTADVVPFSIRTRIDPKLKSWHSQQDAMLFRLIQEALLNIRKHANASEVSVTWQITDGRVVLSIEDDGCGFNAESVPLRHYGILTMKERAEAAGGSLILTSAVSRGTRLVVVFEESEP